MIQIADSRQLTADSQSVVNVREAAAWSGPAVGCKLSPRPLAGTFLLIAVFLLAMLPLAVTPALMYPDEPQYLDAGVLMLASHDWLVPRCPNDAAPEDMKPILTYWIITLCYATFGTSLGAARIPYLLAGAVVVFLTYRLT